MITKTWTTKSGKEVTVTGKLITEKKGTFDGRPATYKTCEIFIDVSVEGFGSQGSWVKELPAPQGEYTHSVGQLALTTDQAEIIGNVEAELEDSKEWQAKVAAEAQADEAEKLYAENQSYSNLMDG